MPEGDTIHRAAANLQRALGGRPITRFETVYAQLARVDDDSPIAGRTVESVGAQGKHLLIHLSGMPAKAAGPLTLRTHMRMSGSWHIYRPGQAWQRSRRDMRIVLHTDAYLAVAFSVPVAEFLTEQALPRSPALRRLGPDLLGETFDSHEAMRRLRAHGSQPLAELVFDQSVVAGVGNIYRSEVLFLAGLDPARSAASVSDDKLGELLAIARRLMQVNVKSNGPHAGGIVTYLPLAATSARRDSGAYFWVYSRRGKPCRRCGTAIAYRKTGLNARGLYYCPSCQR